MIKTVTIDCFPSSVKRYRDGYAVIVIDVIRATTMAITAVSTGRRCLVVDSTEAALNLSSRLIHPLLAGELGGEVPPGFEMNNSPAELVLRADLERPLVLLSSSGTRLMCEAAKCEFAYVACFRNYLSTVHSVIGRHSRVVVIGAGSREEFRDEDQMCCAWIAERLIDSGYTAGNSWTTKIVDRWHGSLPSACRQSESVAYLRRTGQMKDLEFILAHVNDSACAMMQDNEVVEAQKAVLCERDLNVIRRCFAGQMP